MAVGALLCPRTDEAWLPERERDVLQEASKKEAGSLGGWEMLKISFLAWHY